MSRKQPAIVRDIKLLNLLQSSFGVIFTSSSVDATKNPPVVNATIRLPIHKTVHEVIRWESTTLQVRVDKMLRRVIREFAKILRRRDAGHVSDVTIALLLLGLYGGNYALFTHRNKVNRALRQLPRESKIRKYITWRISRLRELHRKGEFP